MRKGFLIVFCSLCLTAAAGLRSDAGDYYVYRDASGRVVLSNNPPPASGKIVKKETLDEVTDQQIAEARARDEAAAADNRIMSLERTVDDLEYRLRTQSSAAEYAQPAYAGNDVFIGVSNGFVWPTHRPPPRPRPNPNPARSPTAPSTLPGGIIPGGSLPGGKMG